MTAVKEALEAPQDSLPRVSDQGQQLQVDTALADLLRVLLKAKSQETGVAAKLIANSADLDRIAAGKRDVAALQGWRAEVFGHDALRLAKGEVGLPARSGAVVLVEL